MIGHKFGEFAPTRTFYGHASDKKVEAQLRLREAMTRQQSAPPARNRGLGRRQDAAHQRAEAQHRRAVDPRQDRARARWPSLTFCERRIAIEVKKVLQAAIANAENNHQLDVDRLVVSRRSVGRRARDEAVPYPRPWPVGRDREAVQQSNASSCASAPRAGDSAEGRPDHGSESQSDRLPGRHQPHLGQPLVRRTRLRQAAA